MAEEQTNILVGTVDLPIDGDFLGLLSDFWSPKQDLWLCIGSRGVLLNKFVSLTVHRYSWLIKSPFEAILELPVISDWMEK